MNMDKVIPERKRGKNVSEKDKCLLAEIMKIHAIDVECKKHDVKVLDKKRSAWMRVATEFNAASDCKKTEEQLKILWKDLKAKAKKQKATSSREIIKTGGGPQEEHVDDISKVIIATIPQMFDAIDGVCDDDVEMSSAQVSFQPIFDATHEEEEEEHVEVIQSSVDLPAQTATGIPASNPNSKFKSEFNHTK